MVKCENCFHLKRRTKTIENVTYYRMCLQTNEYISIMDTKIDFPMCVGFESTDEVKERILKNRKDSIENKLNTFKDFEMERIKQLAIKEENNEIQQHKLENQMENKEVQEKFQAWLRKEEKKKESEKLRKWRESRKARKDKRK